MVSPTRQEQARAAREYFERKLAFTTCASELKAAMERGTPPLIIDVREGDQFAMGHIPGAHHLPEEEWGTLRSLSADAIHVIYGDSANSHLAARAAAYFATHGYQVMELEGGIGAWQEAEYPLEHARAH